MECRVGRTVKAESERVIEVSVEEEEGVETLGKQAAMNQQQSTTRCLKPSGLINKHNLLLFFTFVLVFV